MPEAATQLHSAASASSSTRRPQQQRLPDRDRDRGALRSWALTLSQLHTRATMREKELITWMRNHARGWFERGTPELALVMEAEKSMEEGQISVGKEKMRMQTELKRIKALVGRFKTHLNDPAAHAPTNTDTDGTTGTGGEDSYASALRSLLEQIEEQLSTFKTQAKKQFVHMQLQEVDLTRESEAMIARAERWIAEETEENAAAATSGAAPSRSKKPTQVKSTVGALLAAAASTDDAAEAESGEDTALRATLTRIQNEIDAEGGMNGGWDPRDHAHFLRLFTQHSSSSSAAASAASSSGAAAAAAPTTTVNDAALVARIQREIPSAAPSASHALLHLEWYLRLQARLGERKQTLAKWKALKDRSRKGGDELVEEATVQGEREKAEQMQIQAQLQRSRQETAAAVAAWKARKAEAAAARLEEQKRREAEAEAARKESRELERRRLHSIVEAYHEEKSVLDLVAAMQSAPTERERSERAHTEREAARKLKLKQESLLREVKQKREEKAREKARAIEKKEALLRASAPLASVAVVRDPSRLTRPTSALLARAKQREAEEEAAREYASTHGGRTPATMLGRVSMGHTATPSWRKGI